MIKMKEVCSFLGKRIREERRKLDLTQEELAAKANMGDKFLSRIERGVGVPSLETLMSLSKTLNVSIDSLLVEKKEKEELKSLKDKIEYLFPDISKEKKECLIKIIKETNLLLK